MHPQERTSNSESILFLLPMTLVNIVAAFSHVRQLGALSCTSRHMSQFMEQPEIWNDLLSSTIEDIEAKELFLNHPENRSRYVTFDHKGKIYLGSLIYELCKTHLGPTTILHLNKSCRLLYERLLLLSSAEKIGNVINEISDKLILEETNELSLFQMRGLFAGLNHQQVRPQWFGSAHAGAAEKGIPYEIYKEVCDCEVSKLIEDYQATMLSLGDLRY